ncbi:MAG: biopolymer transporter ExbD [Candidatus Cloacimonetes bacterium]|nr:biopolymer transporter ExbD [Candidatus Cloacimonadota bacterium]
MKLGRKRKNMGGIPTASMSDVAFLLLIFFLTTTKFDIKKGLGLVLPPASQQSESTKKVKIDDKNITKIQISNEGLVMVNKEQIPIAELESMIRKIVKSNADMVISLKSDRMSAYENMVIVLDKLQAAGAEKISLSTN